MKREKAKRAERRELPAACPQSDTSLDPIALNIVKRRLYTPIHPTRLISSKMKFVQVALIASTASFSAALDATRGGRRRRELEDIGDIETMSMSMIDGTMVTADAVSSQGRSKSAKSKSAKEPVNENICAGATGYALPQIPRTGAVTCSGATELNKPSKNEDTWTKFPQTGGVSCSRSLLAVVPDSS